MKTINDNLDNTPQGTETEDEGLELITLEMEDGTTEECEILDFLDVDDKQYVALLPIGKEDYYIFEYVEDGEESDIRYIEDDEEFERVAAEFEEYFDSEDYEEYEDDSEDED